MPIQPWLLRRLERELAEYPFFIDDETIHFSFGKYAIQISELGRRGYPFSPPRVTINGKNLSYTPTYFPPRLIEGYAKKYKCPCCVSIMCPDNWSPSFRITDILNEYVGFVEKLKTFQKLKMFQAVRLPDDMIYEVASFLS